jgi:hypothetical protein
MKPLLESFFQKLEYKVIYYNEKPSANGVDCWVSKNNGRPKSVEIKKSRKLKNGMVQIDPVSLPRKNDDLIAIIINQNYVLIEPMADHLKCCSTKGTRQMTLLCN